MPMLSLEAGVSAVAHFNHDFDAWWRKQLNTIHTSVRGVIVAADVAELIVTTKDTVGTRPFTPYPPLILHSLMSVKEDVRWRVT